MTMADEIDPRLRDFALAPGPGPDLQAIAEAGRRRRRMRQLVPIATAAVLVVILAGIALVVLQGRSAQLEPVRPVPLPTPSASPSPLQFAVEEALSNGEQAYGVGDTDDGIRVDGVAFETATCPDGVECPTAVTLTVTNERSTAFSTGIIVSVYRNGSELTGTGTGQFIEPGATGTVRIVLDPATTAIAPDDGAPGVYTWNWRLERMG